MASVVFTSEISIGRRIKNTSCFNIGVSSSMVGVADSLGVRVGSLGVSDVVMAFLTPSFVARAREENFHGKKKRWNRGAKLLLPVTDPHLANSYGAGSLEGFLWWWCS